jgi:hypothetical protein
MNGSPEGLHMNKWDFSLIEKIFEQKQSEKSEDRDNLLQLTSRELYGEKIHYALELIQNAEDEGSPSIIFVLSDEYLAVINEGKPFDEEDVWAICSVKPAHKRKKIGFFGIGFKSVFNVTEKPRVISNNFNFIIEDFVYPRPKNEIPESLKDYYSPEKGAIFILPHSPGLPSYKELREGFQFLDSKLLLFLDNIKHLKFVDIMNKSEWEIRKSLEGNSTISLFDSRNGEETKWKVFPHDVRVQDKNIIPRGKEGIKETRITIAFPLNDATRDWVKKSGVVYCYLPTKKRTDLPFLIQADFIPTVGRENISDEPWNKWLMRKLGIWATNAINSIRNDEQLGRFIYDFIPLSGEIKDDLIKHLYEPLFESLKKKEIAKITKGWQKPRCCAIPDDDRLRDILVKKDLRLLFNKKLFYINRDLFDRDEFTRAERVLFELGAKNVGINEVIEFVQKKTAIKKKNKEWFLNLYDYLRTEFDVEGKYSWDEAKNALYEKFKTAKFILTDNNKLVSLIDPERPDRYVCYPQRINLGEIHKIFTEGEIVFLNSYFQESSIVRRRQISAEQEEKRAKVKDWFDSIGVKKYFSQVHIIEEVILPKFTSGKYREYDDIKLYRLIDFIRSYWSTIESQIKNKKKSPEFIEQIKRSILLKSFSSKKRTKIPVYKKPDEIYFSKIYGKNEVMEDLFKGIKDIYFLSSYYINREKRERKEKKRGRQKVEYTWKKFFEILGVWTSPRITKGNDWVSVVNNKDYSWIKKLYSPHNIHEIRGDCRSEDLKKIVEYCSALKNQKEIKKRVILLWESLEKNWKPYKEKEIHNVTYRYSHLQRLGEYYYTKINYETSSFLEFLKNARWVSGEDSGFYRPNEVFVATKKNRLLLGDDGKYVNLKANDTFIKDLNIKTEPTIEQVVNHLKMFREKNPVIEENKVEKIQEIYNFLDDKINSIEVDKERERILKEIKQIFHDNELLYLPRADKTWWKPYDVFWKDCSGVFGTLKGYVENKEREIFDSSLKEFFFSLGVVEKPLVKEHLCILEEIKGKGDLELFRKIARNIYSNLNDIVRESSEEKIDWNRPVFLSGRDRFLSPNKLYYCDNDEYKEFFAEKVEILWLPFSYVNVKEFLNVAGFKRLSRDISVIKKFEHISEIESETANQLIKRLSYVENYLIEKKVELYEQLQKEGIFKRVKELQAYETPNIMLDYILKKDGTEPVIVSNIEKNAYLSHEENRIYVSSKITLLSTSVAKELCKLFAHGEEDVLPFLGLILGAENDDELDEKLKFFGVHLTPISIELPSEKLKLIPCESIATDITKSEREPEEFEAQGEALQKPQLPVSEPDLPKPDLIDPDEFIFDSVEEHAPYTKIDGMSGIPARTIKLKEGHPVIGKREVKIGKKAFRGDAHSIALAMILRFERDIENRMSDDRNEQKGIGYDIYSEGKESEVRFIEVKGFRGEPAPWELTSHEWKKAEQEGDRYFVYVVSGLREGNCPIIDIIQNPVKFLTPDPPIQKKFSNWENGIIRKIRCKKF